MYIGVHTGMSMDMCLARQRRDSVVRRGQNYSAATTAVMAYIGHNYMGHEYIVHNYTVHNYIGHNCVVRKYSGHK